MSLKPKGYKKQDKRKGILKTLPQRVIYRQDDIDSDIRNNLGKPWRPDDTLGTGRDLDIELV